MEKDHIRTPILQTLRKSPFTGLQKHFKYVKSGTLALEKAVKYYLKGDLENFKKYGEQVNKSEDTADQVKGNIRNHLPKFIFIPIDKGDFLALLSEADGILDSAEDVVVLMDMRRTKIPEKIKNEFLGVMKKAVETVDALGNAMDLFKFMLDSSFGGKTRQDIKHVIHSIHRIEHESDLIEKKISKQLFNDSNLDAIAVVHLLKIVDRMGCMADHAENAADKIRAMLAK
jgi:predicted phosphate transport protein (TIGR00153 family)